MKAGWESATLGSVCDIISGSGFPKKHQGEADGEVPFFKVGDMNSEGNETHLVAANHYISEATRKALGARVLPPESVVFPKVGGAISTNKKRRLVAPSCVDNNVMGLAPDPQKIDPSYLAWWMDGVDIYEFSNKAALPSITKGTVDAWPIPLPPLEEQKRIVAVLDAAFEGLTRARTHIETNLQNARELFEGAMEIVFDLDRIKGEFARKKLIDVCEIEAGAGFPKKDQGKTSGDFPFFKVGDMNSQGNERNLITANHYISEATRKRLGARIFRPTSIVFPKVGGAIATNKKRKIVVESCVDNNVMGLWPIPEKIDPNYLSWWMESVDIYEFSNKAALPSITKQTVSSWPIPVPSPEKQREIVNSLSQTREYVEQLEAHYRTKMQDLDDLRQSLLQKAFAGELT